MIHSFTNPENLVWLLTYSLCDRVPHSFHYNIFDMCDITRTLNYFFHLSIIKSLSFSIVYCFKQLYSRMWNKIGLQFKNNTYTYLLSKMHNLFEHWSVTKIIIHLKKKAHFNDLVREPFQHYLNIFSKFILVFGSHNILSSIEIPYWKVHIGYTCEVLLESWNKTFL